jgi:hypothetical protein
MAVLAGACARAASEATQRTDRTCRRVIVIDILFAPNQGRAPTASAQISKHGTTKTRDHGNHDFNFLDPVI